MNKELWGIRVTFYVEPEDEISIEYDIVRANNFIEVAEMVNACYGNLLIDVTIECLGDILDLNEDTYEKAKELISY